MRLSTSVAIVLALAISLVGSTHGIAQSQFIGATAEYSITTARTLYSTRLTVDSLEGPSTTNTESRETVTAVVRAAVVAERDGVITVSTETLSTGSTVDRSYQLRSDALLKEVDVDPDGTFRRTLTLVGMDARTESGAVVDGWVTSLSFDSEPFGSLVISLTSRSGPVETENRKALLLLPMLIPPDEPVAVVRQDQDSQSSPKGGRPAFAAPLQLVQASSIGELLTKDNPTINRGTTVSQFLFEGRWQDPGNYGYTIWFDHSNTKPLLPNWFVTGPGPSSWPYWTDIPQYSYESGTGEGRVTFLGYFPIPRGQVWEQMYYHKVVLRQTSHDTWLYSEIYRNQYIFIPPSIFAQRSLHKANWFWSGQTFANGTNQLAEWYIIESLQELLLP